MFSVTGVSSTLHVRNNVNTVTTRLSHPPFLNLAQQLESDVSSLLRQEKLYTVHFTALPMTSFCILDVCHTAVIITVK